jgi:hypothetical protein
MIKKGVPTDLVQQEFKILKMKIALVCIAKNEDHYLEEWINYNKKLGFDDIFIYQNDWRWSGESENVHKIEFDGINKQRDSYNNFIKNYHDKYDWVAFFDVDEFLVLKKHNDVKLFVSDYSQYPAIGVNWVLFGNNGHSKVDGDYSVIKRFTKRQKDVNQHIKSIVKLSRDTHMDIHCPSSCWWVNPHNEKNQGSFTSNHTDDIAQINHYFCKTEEEFQEKCDKGRADNPIIRRTMSEYEGHNCNDIEDFSAYKFLYE